MVALHSHLHPRFHLLEVSLQVLQVGLDQPYYSLIRNRSPIGVPNLWQEHFRRRLLLIQLLSNRKVNLNLMIQQHKQTNMKLNFRQDLGNIREKIITLHIQKDRHVSFVSHYLVYLLHLQVNVDSLILLVYFPSKIVLLDLLLRLVLLRHQVVRYLRTHTGLSHHLVSTHIALTASERNCQTILAHNRLLLKI